MTTQPMTIQSEDAADDPGTPASPAPTTGHRLVDAALTEYGQLSNHPPAEHHQRISQVSEVLASVLKNRHDSAQTSIPGTRPQPGMPGPRH